MTEQEYQAKRKELEDLWKLGWHVGVDGNKYNIKFMNDVHFLNMFKKYKRLGYNVEPLIVEAVIRGL